MWIRHALLAFTIICDITYFLACLPFGVADAPGKHKVPSNMTVDLAQALIDDETWDPTELNSIHAEQIPQIKRNDAEIPFRKANHLAIDVPPRECYADGYVDDLITAVLDFLRATNRARHAVPLTLNVMYRPVNDDDPIHRDKFLSRWKLTAEGGLEEIKTVLGWRIDMRILNLRT